MNFFESDNALFRFINTMGELIILNVLFLIGTLGIITFGASLTALYTVLIKIVRKESGYIVREFWSAYRRNFFQATILWAIFILAGTILYLDIIISDYIDGGLSFVLKTVFLCLGVLYISVLSYLFAVLSRFENTLFNTLKNSFWMAVGYFPFTISVLVLECIPIFLIYIRPFLIWYLIPVMAGVGFAAIAYGCAFVFDHIFKNYMPE